uniref:Uncharacterized protein n=1 Tax=Oryza brachyantha TaxID=4533 RepID=J3LJH0_ORYBR
MALASSACWLLAAAAEEESSRELNTSSRLDQVQGESGRLAPAPSIAGLVPCGAAARRRLAHRTSPQRRRPHRLVRSIKLYRLPCGYRSRPFPASSGAHEVATGRRSPQSYVDATPLYRRLIFPLLFILINLNF